MTNEDREDLARMIEPLCCDRPHGCEVNEDDDCPVQRTTDAIIAAGWTRQPSAWLIEMPQTDNSPARWWNPGYGWMLDAAKAVWFCRAEDALAYIKTSSFTGGIIATEHRFGLPLLREAAK